MIELAILILVIGIAVFKIINPEVRLACITGFHKYVYAYTRHGMHMDGDKVVGTSRKVYVCYGCEREKPSDPKDYNNQSIGRGVR